MKKYLDSKKIAFELNKVATKIWQENTEGESKKEFTDYIKMKQYNDSIVKQFKLGIASNQNQIVKYINSLENKELRLSSLEIALNIGLIKKDEDGSLKDTFKNRIIFPLFDQNSNVCGFSGRAISDKNKCRYINSRRSRAFSKDNFFYGLDLFNKSKFDQLILVEGITDYLRLYQHGFKNVIALLGSSIQDEQVQSFSNNLEKVYLCFDNDIAGEKISIKVAKQFLNTGISSRRINLLESNDPDDFIIKYGQGKFISQLENAGDTL